MRSSSPPADAPLPLLARYTLTYQVSSRAVRMLQAPGRPRWVEPEPDLSTYHAICKHGGRLARVLHVPNVTRPYIQALGAIGQGMRWVAQGQAAVAIAPIVWLTRGREGFLDHLGDKLFVIVAACIVADLTVLIGVTVGFWRGLRRLG